MNFTIGQEHEVTFSVNVMGTSADPSCRLILETFPEMGFPCRKIGDSWGTSVFLPSNLKPGNYKMRVEVTLNNRLFTPFSKPIEITAPTESVQVQTVATNPSTEAPPAPAPVETAAHAADEPVEMEVEFAAEEKPVTTKIDLKSIFSGEPVVEPVVEAVTAPAAPAKITIPADLFKFTPKPVKKVEVKIPSIGEALEKIGSGLAKAGTTPLPRLRIGESSELVTLSKGDIVYE